MIVVIQNSVGYYCGYVRKREKHWRLLCCIILGKDAFSRLYKMWTVLYVYQSH